MAHTFHELTSMSMDQLDGVLAQGKAPKFSSLAGWEFRGWNVFGNALAAGVGRVMGIQRFAKGFFARGKPLSSSSAAEIDALETLEGYNIPIRHGTRDEPWTAKPDDDHIKRFAFYKIYRPNEGASRAGRHPHSLFLHYSGGTPRPGVFEGGALVGDGGLKDYVVEVDGNPDLIVGKAYYDLGPISNANFFVAERLRKADWQPT